VRLKAIVAVSASCFVVCVLIAAQIGVRAAMPQTRGGQNQPPQPAPREMTAPDIPGVIKGGTKVTLIRDGFNGTEAVISMPDGSMLFTEQDADKILKIDNNGRK
jgi:glucose/arabinose dehydrogenase